MTLFRIGSRANDAWDFVEPARPSSDARTISLSGRDVTPGEYKWLHHPTAFLVATPGHEHLELMEHLKVAWRDCERGVMDVMETADGLDVVFASHDEEATIGVAEITDRIEAWLRAGAPLTLVDAGQ